MGSCTWFGAVSGRLGLRREGGRERESVCVCVAVLSGREMDRGGRATMWVFPQDFCLQIIMGQQSVQ